jgi:hypothetical protein
MRLPVFCLRKCRRRRGAAELATAAPPQTPDCNSAKWEEQQRKADAAANGIGPSAAMFKMTKTSIGKTCFQFNF